MIKRDRKFFLFCSMVFGILLCAGCVASQFSDQKSYPKVKIHTDVGAIVIEVDTEKAPVTAANFLRYVDEKRFTTASFYRVVRMDNQPDSPIKIEVIQGGIGFIENPLRLPPITHETTKETGIRHTNGVISMARDEPGTASSEIFICIGDQPALDFGGGRNPDGQGFAAFGRVIQGMDVVKKIQSEPADGQMLLLPIRITEIVRVENTTANE